MTFQRGQGLNHPLTNSVKLCKAIVDCWQSNEGFVAGRAATIERFEIEINGSTGKRGSAAGQEFPKNWKLLRT